MKRLLITGMIVTMLTMGVDRSEAQTPVDTTVLQKVADGYLKPPENAQIDQVWKLIPALNGLELDRQQTALHWNKENPATTKLVFRQIPPAVPTSAFPHEPIYRGNGQKRQMSLMFNVAWGEEYLPSILKTLSKNHAHATFFLDGKWASQHPDFVKQLIKSGMELGNHGYNHHLFSRLSKTQMTADLTKANSAILAASDRQPTLFAPPAGDFNQTAVKVAAGFGMKTILWTLDTVDWRRPQPEVIAMRVLMKKNPGALVLMHPTSPTAKALPGIIKNLQIEGYQLVTVSDLISSFRPHPNTLQAALDGLRLPR